MTACVCITAVSLLLLVSRHHSTPHLGCLGPGEAEVEDINPLDGCRHVYLDMGTNVGVQIRYMYVISRVDLLLVEYYLDRDYPQKAV